MLSRVALRRFLMTALLARGDESAMNFEGLGVSFSTYLLFSAPFLQVGSELHREGVAPSVSPRSRIGRVLIGWAHGGAIIRPARY